MEVTGAAIRAALDAAGAVGRQLRTFDELAAGATSALRQAPPGLTSAGAASFLATCAQESAYFRTTVEYGTGQRYAPYIGRTLVQVTWEANYRAFGRWCHARGLVADPEVFVRSPVSLGAYEFAWLGPVWYFAANDLWPWANSGDHLRVSQAVNGGRGRAGTSFVPHGMPAREAMYRAFRDALPATTARPGAPAPDEGDDMEADERAALFEARDLLRLLKPGVRLPGRSAGFAETVDDHYGWAMTGAGRADDAARGIAAMHERLDEVLASRVPAGSSLTADDVRQILREALADAGPLYLTTKETP